MGVRDPGQGAAMSNSVPRTPLRDGTSIPQLGFGVFQVPPEDTEKTVLTAFEVGYRHIDTAEMYQNEEGVGAAIRSAGIPRDELYVTSKLNNGFHRPDDARRAFDDTMRKLGLDRLDLFLIHWPLPTLYDGDYVSTWRGLREFQQDRRVALGRGQLGRALRMGKRVNLVGAVSFKKKQVVIRSSEDHAERL